MSKSRGDTVIFGSRLTLNPNMLETQMIGNQPQAIACVDGHLVTLCSRKQNVVSCFNAKAEYHARTETPCETLWL